MKKKIINGIMMVALVAATSTSFVSCKDTNEDVRVEMNQANKNLLEQLEALNTKYGKEIPAINDSITSLKTQVKNHAKDIATLQKEIDELEYWIEEAFSKLVFNVNIAGTYNNMVGEFDLPGVSPMMLISNYGEAQIGGKFPKNADLLKKGYHQIEWAQNDKFGESDEYPGVAGFLYAGINRYFDDMPMLDTKASFKEEDKEVKGIFKFDLVTTGGNIAEGVQIVNIDPLGGPTKDDLYWGWTRSDNNVYKFGVTYNGSKAKDLEPTRLSLSQLKDDLKAAWRNRNTADKKKSVGRLFADVYYNYLTQNTNLKKYALRISWEDATALQNSDNEHDEYTANENDKDGDIIKVGETTTEKKGLKHMASSDFDIMFACIKPFGFDPGSAESLSETVHGNVGKVNNLIEKSEKLWNKIFDRIKAQLPEFKNFNGATVATNTEGKYIITIPKADLATATGIALADAKDLVVDVDDIVRPLNLTIDQVNDMMAQARAMKEKLKGSSVTNFLEKFTNKFDNVIKNNAEQLLTPVLLVRQGNEVGRVSGLKSDPTEVSGEVILEPTSYTAEFIAPAYMKFVGCKDITADGFNEIIGINYEDLKFTPEAGKTYEIVYEAVDFLGHTFEHPYYIKGKK